MLWVFILRLKSSSQNTTYDHIFFIEKKQKWILIKYAPYVYV